jgi:hypothetical protein
MVCGIYLPRAALRFALGYLILPFQGNMHINPIVGRPDIPVGLFRGASPIGMQKQMPRLPIKKGARTNKFIRGPSIFSARTSQTSKFINSLSVSAVKGAGTKFLLWSAVACYRF